MANDAVVRSYETPGFMAWRRATDTPLTILAIGSLPVLILEIERSALARTDQLFLDVVNFVVLIAFAIDYGVELALCRDRPRFVRSEWTSLLIVIAQALAVLPGLSGFGVLRACAAHELSGSR